MKPNVTDDLSPMTKQIQACPCQSAESTPHTYEYCCQPLHNKARFAATAEQLMRSRYSAFFLGHNEYLHYSHHPSMRQKDTNKLTDRSSIKTQWHGLNIIASENGKDSDEKFVEFIAHYSENNSPGLLHEKSRFVKEGKQWLYIDGEIIANSPITLPNRNALCWCGSKKKFKKCHL